MSGVMNTNNSSKSCSIKDIESICEDHKNKFSLNDAQKLCRLKITSFYNFGKKNISQNLNPIPEQKIKQEVNVYVYAYRKKKKKCLYKKQYQ